MLKVRKNSLTWASSFSRLSASRSGGRSAGQDDDNYRETYIHASVFGSSFRSSPFATSAREDACMVESSIHSVWSSSANLGNGTAPTSSVGGTGWWFIVQRIKEDLSDFSTSSEMWRKPGYPFGNLYMDRDLSGVFLVVRQLFPNRIKIACTGKWLYSREPSTDRFCNFTHADPHHILWSKTVQIFQNALLVSSFPLPFAN